MFLMFARFDFKGSDLAAEDRNYLDNHVRLARQLLGVRMYLTGKLLETTDGKPDRYRAVVFGYDSPQAAAASLDCPAGVEMAADSAGHIVGTLVDACEGQIAVPFDRRRPGQPVTVAALMYNPGQGANEARLRSYQNSIRGLTGLCGYMHGRTCEARGQKPDRDWMEIRIFVSDARGKISSEQLALDESIVSAPRIYCFEGEVQI
jgi:uncharacterized protein (TIGR02118 family)